MSSAEQLAVRLSVTSQVENAHDCRMVVACASLQISFLCFKSLYHPPTLVAMSTVLMVCHECPKDIYQPILRLRISPWASPSTHCA